jgi:transposase
MVQTRTRIMNQLQAVALNEGLLCRKKLWRERGRQQLEAFRLAPWASRRRHDLLELLDRLDPTIAELSQAIEGEVEKCPAAQKLMTHPGVGPLTALAFVLIIGDASRFQCGKQVASYLGLVPLEDSSGNRRRLGHITQQGSSMLRFLLGCRVPTRGAQRNLTLPEPVSDGTDENQQCQFQGDGIAPSFR